MARYNWWSNNKLLTFVKDNENEFIELAISNSETVHTCELKNAKKSLKQAQSRINEIDELFIKLYEDNVSGKISDSRFEIISKKYEDEQNELMASSAELTDFIERIENKKSDVIHFVEIIRKYEKITELTHEIIHELIEKIVVHAPEGSRANRTQQIDIHFRFNIATSTAVADFRNYFANKKAVQSDFYTTFILTLFILLYG